MLWLRYGGGQGCSITLELTYFHQITVFPTNISNKISGPEMTWHSAPPGGSYLIVQVGNRWCNSIDLLPKLWLLHLLNANCVCVCGGGGILHP